MAAADGTTFRLNRFTDPALIRQLTERSSGSVLSGLDSLDLQEILQSISHLKELFQVISMLAYSFC